MANAGMDTLEAVMAAINSADNGFYTWLEGIGALTKDGRGNTRGTTTWPGAFDNGQ